MMQLIARALLVVAFMSVGAPAWAQTVKYILQGTTTFTVPTDWNDSDNKIECIGAGGSGATGVAPNGGGGGGAYSASTNVNMPEGSVVTVQVGDGVSTASTAGTDTWICNSTSNCASAVDTAVVCGADGGSGGSDTASTTAPGGQTGNGTGTVKFAGGTGGSSGGSGCEGGAGGGGAAGPHGAGGNGGLCPDNSVDYGAGGGGADGGGAGANGQTLSAGAGGTNRFGTGAGAAGGGTGSDGGGGGGGGIVGQGGLGSFEPIWSVNHGPGSAGGGGGPPSGGRQGANYGGGGGGAGDGGTNGAGADGLIIVSYTPSTANNPVSLLAILGTWGGNSGVVSGDCLLQETGGADEILQEGPGDCITQE
jgi:hypothetical protein